MYKVTEGKITGISRESGRVYINDKPLDLNKSLKIRNHSPSGFSWGYSGSGPAQLALAILIELSDTETAQLMYQQFKDEFISKLEDRWTLSIEAVIRWIEVNKK